jgi:hypothetical protein
MKCEKCGKSIGAHEQMLCREKGIDEKYGGIWSFNTFLKGFKEINLCYHCYKKAIDVLLKWLKEEK